MSKNIHLALSGIFTALVSISLLIFLHQRNISESGLETTAIVATQDILPFEEIYSIVKPLNIQTIAVIERLTIIAPDILVLNDTGKIEVRYQLEIRSENPLLSKTKLKEDTKLLEDTIVFPIKVSLASPSINVTQPEKLDRIIYANSEEVWYWLLKPTLTGKSTVAFTFSGPTVELLNVTRVNPSTNTYSIEVKEIGKLLNESINVSDGFQILRDIEVVDSFGLSNRLLKLLGYIGNFLGSALTLPWLLEKIKFRQIDKVKGNKAKRKKVKTAG